MRKAPTNLKHKTVYVINDYQKIDGEYKTILSSGKSIEPSDVHALSIGLSQWDDTVPSIKVWRKNPNGKWSRQSEETTITRALDMAMMSIKILDHVFNNKPLVGEKTMNGDLFEIEVMNNNLKSAIDSELNKRKADIDTHIKILREALAEYKE